MLEERRYEISKGGGIVIMFREWLDKFGYNRRFINGNGGTLSWKGRMGRDYRKFWKVGFDIGLYFWLRCSYLIFLGFFMS